MISYKNQKYNVLAIVPARSGSKGIKNKNIKKVNKIPLLGFTGLFIKKLNFIDNAVCSTDSKLYAKLATKYGLDTPFLRPVSLSGDRIGDVDVLKHALLRSENYYNKKFDLVIMLQPTSPLRKVRDLVNAINQLFINNLDAIWSVSPTDLKNHPYKQLLISKNKLSYFSNKGKNIIARQQLEQTYKRNGIFYILKRELVLKKLLINRKTGSYIIKDRIINIDTLKDFKEFYKIIMGKK